MSKAVLVIDMVDNCYDCPLCINDEYGLSLKCCLKYKEYVNKEGKPNWCPLKLLPEEDNRDYLLEWSRGYQGGWNDCINAIMGE